MPAANRGSGPGWRDPRLWVGLALVAGSVVAGARVLGAADETTAVWAAAHSLPAGHELAAEDLEVARVRLDDRSLDRYLLVDAALPPDLTLTTAVEPGELVAASALGAGEEEDVQEVALALPPDSVPPSLRAGSTVDVWVVEKAPEEEERSRLALSEVRVVAVPRLTESFGSTGGSRSVVVAIPEEQRPAIARILSASARDGVQLTVRG
jgi:hypothetical protein